MESNRFSAVLVVPEMKDYNVFGLRMGERILSTLYKAGVNEVFIVSHNWDKTKAAASLQPVVNLYPVEKLEQALTRASETANEGVFLITGPLVVDVSVLEDLKTAFLETPAVLTDSGGLALAKPDAVARLTPYTLVNGQLKEALGSYSIFSVGNRTCHIVHSAADLRQVKQRMIANLTKPSDGLVSRHLNRKISTAISRRLSYLPITPNQITLFTGLIAFVPCYFMYEGGYWNWLIGAATYQLASVLDGVDGEIARLKMQSSKFGQWLDTLLDFVSMIAVLGCLVAGVHRVDQPEFIRWAGNIAIVFSLLSFLGLLLFLIRFRQGGSFNIRYGYLDGKGKWDKVLQSLAFMGKRDFYIFFFLVLALFGLMPWALVYIGGFALLIFVLIIKAHLQTKQS